MNSKAIKRQLLAAIAMVLVAAIALGSSTYAWFVGSGTVTAEGMKIQAQSEGGLAIRWTGQPSQLWGTTASAKMNTAASLLPTSTYDLRNWSHAAASTPDSSTAKDGTYTDITETVLGKQKDTYQANNGYVLMQPFEVRSTSEAQHAKGLYVSGVTVTSATHDLDKALRVGVRLTPRASGAAEVAYIYAPVAEATTNYSWNNGTNTHAVTLAQVGTEDNGASRLLADTVEIPYAEGSAIDVEIYIWYEGEDAKLYSDNYHNGSLDVSVQFSSYGFKTA